ncbi:MAG TPA: dockerin type I repeat-containing protein, partial [Armatimonadota bacterium]
RTGPTIEPANDIFLYLNVDDTFLLNGNPTREAWVTMEYWDGGTAAFTLNYDAGPGFPAETFKGAETGNRTDTGTWKTFTWHLTDASFNNREQGTADLRIGDSDTGDDNDLYISKVTVSTVDPAGPPPTTVVKGDVTGDGKVAITDVVTGLRIVAGLLTATADQLKAGDFNGNGKLDISEVIQILRVVAGLATF